MNYTRIVCTIGPSTLNDETLRSLGEVGLSIARLNGSHADLNWHKIAISKIREILPDVPILLDIPGRKIRTLQLRHEPTFNEGDIIVLTTDPSYDGKLKVPVNYKDLHKDLERGNTVMADDGTLKFIVDKVEGLDIFCRAETSGQLKSRKGINVPFVNLNTPQVTERDKRMISFAQEYGVDFIGLSFVESADHIEAFRNLIKIGSPRIVAKVENQGGIKNLKEIVKAADAIMIDRGDLSVETSLHDVAIKQKNIIDAAKEHGCPVIVATEMLHTMIQNPFPTKAEVSDITNAVLDGCSATMLSGETAMGIYALESVRTMKRVIEAAESYINLGEKDLILKEWNIPGAISRVIPTLCKSLPITKIVALTRSGYAARMIAVHRLRQPIIAVSDDLSAARSFNLIGGTIGVFSEIPFSRISTDHVLHVLQLLWRKKMINGQDMVLAAGISYPTPGSRMNTLQVYMIGDLAKEMKWDSTQVPEKCLSF